MSWRKPYNPTGMIGSSVLPRLADAGGRPLLFVTRSGRHGGADLWDTVFGLMILEKIRQLYPKLTKSQKRLADFIATSYQEAAFMTASRLARRVASTRRP